MRLTGRSRPITRWITAVPLLLVPALAAGQSLGDAARKEQARREKARQAGSPARTFTSDDLSATTGRLANDPNGPTANPQAAEPAAATRAAPPVARARRGPEASLPETGEAYWRGRVAAARDRVLLARQRYDDIQLMIRFGQPAMNDRNGRQVIYSIYQMKARGDAAAAELAAAERALESLLDEARRSGALPGWLR